MLSGMSVLHFGVDHSFWWFGCYIVCYGIARIVKYLKAIL